MDWEYDAIIVQEGVTPLNSAASLGHEAVVQLLLEFKAAVDTADKVVI